MHIEKEEPTFNIDLHFPIKRQFLFIPFFQGIKPRCATVLTNFQRPAQFLMIDYCNTDPGCTIHLASVKRGEGSRRPHTSFWCFLSRALESRHSSVLHFLWRYSNGERPRLEDLATQRLVHKKRAKKRYGPSELEKQ